MGCAYPLPIPTYPQSYNVLAPPESFCLRTGMESIPAGQASVFSIQYGEEGKVNSGDDDDDDDCDVSSPSLSAEERRARRAPFQHPLRVDG